ncbi:glycosyltransferase [Nocardioides sp. dk4132]|uniref:glycosyltransferase n=1 Tax=unclassified Nocardioides TaxID=2615069 RepID=UPI0012950DA2|nr:MULTISPECIES: glycosyltransferase family 2 protein [unclassified Nocardioides]MQW77575.1 glycosyltransferase [Nocardioides sp. dk4132]QGA06105.1 glycosyltransferase [Nocardioides sp. dk884]
MTTTTTTRAEIHGATVGGRRALDSVVAVLPAHNEEAVLGAALTSLANQTEPPSRVLVVADNCTDRTAEIARSHGAEVLVTVGNVHKKAGALNQALAQLLPTLDPAHLVLVMDADCSLDPQFLQVARAALADPRLGGVGGTFRGGPGGGLLGTFQRNEYARYERDVRRLKGRALVLTGTASVFPVPVLEEVAAARRELRLPDQSGAGAVYDVHVLTEDNELSLALLHLGYQIKAPHECTLETEVMCTWKALGDQRLRWKRGALENLLDYGWTPVTRRYWGRQLLSAIGVLASVLYLMSLAVGMFLGIELHWFWLALTGVFMLERVVTVRSRGLRQMLLGAVIVVEMVFDLFLQLAQARAFAQVALGTDRKW